MAWIGEQDRCQSIIVGIGVVAEHTRRRDGQSRIEVSGITIIHSHRRMVRRPGVHSDRDFCVVRCRRTVAVEVGKAVRA